MKVQPFFARYLETQQKSGGAVTMRYPSDQEDGGAATPSPVVTMRYPSDNEDAGADTSLRLPTNMVKVLHPKLTEDAGRFHTLKYPSDNEDAGQCPASSGDQPGLKEAGMLQKFLAEIMKVLGLGGADSCKAGQVATMKFPSDSDSIF
jgi:hypothetical protein